MPSHRFLRRSHEMVGSECSEHAKVRNCNCTYKSNLGASLFFLCRYVLVKFGFLTEFLDWFFLDTFTLLLFNVSGKFLGQLVLPQDSAECRPDRGPSTA